MKKHLEYRVVNRVGNIFRSITANCVVDFKEPIFEMCRSGDIRGIQAAIQNISLHVVNPLGMKLLHVSTILDPCHHRLQFDSMRRVAFRKNFVPGSSKGG